jgi:hypothetical protein
MALHDLRSRPRAVPIGDATVYVRSLTIGELEQVVAIEKSGDNIAALKLRLSLGLVEEDGAQAVEGADDPALLAIPLDAAAQIGEAILKASNPGDPDAIAKNSETTSEQSS